MKQNLQNADLISHSI